MSARCTREQWEIAKRWGQAHGYSGKIGGWVYDPEGKPATQGWGALFFFIGEAKMMEWASLSGVLAEVMGEDAKIPNR